ncbi:hypothetical protein V6N13_065848 [Hibiscus sabdariffa]
MASSMAIKTLATSPFTRSPLTKSLSSVVRLVPFSTKSDDDDAIPTAGISRPLSDILKELNKKVPDSLVKLRNEDGFTMKYIPWHIVNRIMNLHAPGKSFQFQSLEVKVKGRMYKTKQLWTPLSTVFRRFLPTTSKLDSTTKRCWNCVADAPGSTPFLYCDSCRSIQPVDLSIDYFQIFGLEKKYEIEVDGLEGKYKDWQKKLHPDLVHSKSEKEREYAAEQSARVIDAYRTLSKPLSRAIYILRLEGVDVDEEQTVSDPELLTEIMEIREAVEEAPDSQALNQIQSRMNEKLEETSDSFANAFQRRNFDEAVTSLIEVYAALAMLLWDRQP